MCKLKDVWFHVQPFLLWPDLIDASYEMPRAPIQNMHHLMKQLLMIFKMTPSEMRWVLQIYCLSFQWNAYGCDMLTPIGDLIAIVQSQECRIRNIAINRLSIMSFRLIEPSNYVHTQRCLVPCPATFDVAGFDWDIVWNVTNPNSEHAPSKETRWRPLICLRIAEYLLQFSMECIWLRYA